MYNKNNPFAKKPFGRIRRRPNRQRQTERQLQEALAKIENLKQLEDTVKLLEDDRRRSLEKQKEEEAAEAAAVAAEVEKIRIESLVREAIQKNSVHEAEATTLQTASASNQKEPDNGKNVEPEHKKMPWYRRIFNFQY